MKGVKKEIVVFSVYLPPGIKGEIMTDILEALTDAVSEAKAKADDPWLIIGGDFNRYDTSGVSLNVPELTQAVSEPTRGDATLDYSFTNFDSLIENTCLLYTSPSPRD